MSKLEGKGQFQPSGEIYHGGINREGFKELIQSLLQKGKIKQHYIEELLNEDNMLKFNKAFTSKTANEEENYEIYEQLGDLSANKFIVWYAYRRFPQLDCPLGVKVVARLRINYGSRQTFSMIGEKLGFWPYITADMEERNRSKKDLLEDCVESFIGCVEDILDKKFRPGVGYAIVYDILSSIFDEIPISLRYEDLYDAKTRLKELFDSYSELGSWKFNETRNPETNMVTSQLLMTYNTPKGLSKEEVIGYGVAAKKADAQQEAAKVGLENLNKAGWKKSISEEYKYFCS
tara:strand:- start:2387 stop:3256 length:870 start_codon:yes stop_codon:yes gene_type:complete